MQKSLLRQLGKWCAEEGGPGVTNLKSHNESLTMKNLHKIFIKLDIPWVNIISGKTPPKWKATKSCETRLFLVEG